MLIVFHCGNVLRAELDRIHHQAHGRLGREDVFLLGDVFLEDVVLSGAAQLVRAHTLLLGGGDVHGPDDGRGRVDRHAGGDLVQRDAVQQDFHILRATRLPRRICRIRPGLRASRCRSPSAWAGRRQLKASLQYVLLVEHHADLIFDDICDRVTVLNLGKVLASGSPDYVRSHREVINAYLGA